MLLDSLYFWLILMVGGFSFFIGAALGWTWGEK